MLNGKQKKNNKCIKTNLEKLFVISVAVTVISYRMEK